MQIGFRVVKRFDTSRGEVWTRFLEFSELTQLREVVGLDGTLCPPLLHVLANEDWAHLVYAEQLFATFDDPAYALARAAGASSRASVQLLAVAREPAQDGLPDLPGFERLGFELIEERTAISALTNCGGFAGAFAPRDLNEHGLVPELARALQIRARLGQLYPAEPHAQCALWAIWRYVGQLP